MYFGRMFQTTVILSVCAYAYNGHAIATENTQCHGYTRVCVLSDGQCPSGRIKTEQYNQDLRFILTNVRNCYLQRTERKKNPHKMIADSHLSLRLTNSDGDLCSFHNSRSNSNNNRNYTHRAINVRFRK